MEPITTQDVELRIDLMNRILFNNKSAWQVHFSHRYNYYVIERIETCNGLPYSDPLVAGSKRECYNYICGMLRAIDMYTE